MKKMIKSIWKYKLEMVDSQTIEIPVGSDLLTIQIQNGEPFMWFLVDVLAERQKITFETWGTGRLIEYKKGENREYLGTYQLNNGELVFHVFERFDD